MSLSIGVWWFRTKLRQLVGLGSSFLAVFGILCCPVYASFDSSWIGQTYDLTSGLIIEDPCPAPAEDTENFYSSRRLLSSSPSLAAVASSPSGSSSDLTVDLDFSSAVVSPSASNRYDSAFVSGGNVTYFYNNNYTGFFGLWSLMSADVEDSLVNQMESDSYVFGWRASVSAPPSLDYPSGSSFTEVTVYNSPYIMNFDVSIPVHFDSPVYGVSFSFAGDYPSYRFLSESNNFLDRVSAFGSFFLVEVNGSTIFEGRFGSESVLSFSSPVQDLTIRFFSPGLSGKFSVADSCPWWSGWPGVGSGASFEDCFNAGTFWYQYLMEVPDDFRFIVSGTDGFAAGDQQMIVNDNISSSASDFASSEDSFVNSVDSSIDAALPSDFGSSLDSDSTAGLTAVSSSFSSFWDTLPSGFLSYFLAFMTVGLAAFILRRVG